MSWAGDGHHQHGGGDHAAEHAVRAHGTDGRRARRMALSLAVCSAFFAPIGGWLVVTNWVRTAAWTLRSALAVWMLGQAR